MVDLAFGGNRRIMRKKSYWTEAIHDLDTSLTATQLPGIISDTFAFKRSHDDGNA